MAPGVYREKNPVICFCHTAITDSRKFHRTWLVWEHLAYDLSYVMNMLLHVIPLCINVH